MANVPISGIISFINGSDKVIGSPDAYSRGPAFTTEIMAGDLIKLPTDSVDNWTTVKSIESNSVLYLTKPYAGNTGKSDYVIIQQNEIKAFINNKIPEMYREEISAEDLDVVTNVVASSYLTLLPKIKDMKNLYDLDNVDTDLLPYIAFLVGYQFDSSLGQVSSFLQQPILQKNQVKNAVAWQKLKGSTFGIQQYLKTLAIQATIKELWYDSTFRSLLDSVKELKTVNELWHKDISSNSIQLFQGNNGIDTSAINHLVSTVLDGNLIYTPVENGTITVSIWQQEITSIAGVSSFSANSIVVNGTLTNYTLSVQPGYKIKLNSGSAWFVVATVDSDIRLTLTAVSNITGTGATSVITPNKVLKTRIIQDVQHNFVYDPATPNTIQVKLGTAQVKGTKPEVFQILTTQTDKLRIKVNNGPEQIATLPGSSTQSVGVIANAINNQITGIVATGESGYLVLTSQDNSFYTKFEVIADPRSAHSVLGIPLGVYTAQTLTGFDVVHSEYLTVELLFPEDFSELIGEIQVDYQYADFVAPPVIVDNQYGTGARSNWFDIELQAKNNAFILLADDVKNIVTKIQTDVKPFHALLRTIRYLSGFNDIWQFQIDQPSFFIPWRDYFRIIPNLLFNERMRFGYASCTCQCCLLYDNCVKKQYNGNVNYNWSFGIYYDSAACYPRDLLIVYNGFIQHYGTSSLPTHTLTGTLTFTDGSKNVSATGGLFTAELTNGISFLKFPGSDLWYRVAVVTDNDNLILEQPFVGSGVVTNVPALDPMQKTAYRYTLTYLTQNIIQKDDPNRLVVYYDGRRYYDKEKNSYCIFHYDLGEYAKTIGTVDEDFIVAPSNNKLLIQPLTVKELTGFSSWTNSSNAIGGVNTAYTTELTLGDLIKPSNVGIDWYTVSNIIDDFNIEVSTVYAGVTVTNGVTDRKVVVHTPLTITLTPGVQTADSIAAEINNQIGQQSQVADTLTGTVTFTNGDATVTGVSTDFEESVSAGIWVQPTGGSVWYQVKYVHSDTDFELYVPFAQVTITTTADIAFPQIILDWGIPLGFGTGFVRLLCNIQLSTTSKMKGAIELEPIANDAYTLLAFDKLYSKAAICYMLYNPSPSSIIQIVDVSGNITFTNGSNIVTGVGTVFSTELQAGDLIKLNSDAEQYYSYVTQIISNISLALDGNYLGTTGTVTRTKALRAIYNNRLTGQVYFVNGDADVTGIGTKFLTELQAGDLIRPAGETVWGEVNTIIDNFNLTLTVVWAGANAGTPIGTCRKIKPGSYTLGAFRIQPDLLLASVSS